MRGCFKVNLIKTPECANSFLITSSLGQKLQEIQGSDDVKCFHGAYKEPQLEGRRCHSKIRKLDLNFTTEFNEH